MVCRFTTISENYLSCNKHEVLSNLIDATERFDQVGFENLTPKIPRDCTDLEEMLHLSSFHAERI